jgi:ubiquinone/menaquinone biosynthesis C-methylase UbiE
MTFRMNSPEGKAILALVREGDYAHPGEEDANALVAETLSGVSIRRAIDVGCGRGGTADWFHRHVCAMVVGVDIDAASVDYARQKYPQVQFLQGDVMQLSKIAQGSFDLAYLFSSFYAFPDQMGALREIRVLCNPGAHLLVFDYTQTEGCQLPAALGIEIGRPIVPGTFPSMLKETGWDMIYEIYLTNHFVRWYANLLTRFERKRPEILALAGSEWYEFVTAWYGALHDALRTGLLGGAIFHALAAPV